MDDYLIDYAQHPGGYSWITVLIPYSDNYNVKHLHTASILIFKYLQDMMYLHCVNCQCDTGWEKGENSPVHSQKVKECAGL